MNINTILKKSWQILWNYRALWLFGAILALVAANAIYPPTWPDWENTDQWTKIKLSEATILRVPGADMIVDFTAPGGIRIINENGISWREINDLVETLNREVSIDLWPILIESGVILASLFLLGTIARYIVETALIRMVNDTEETSRRLNVWQGLRKGFSIRAGRLFLLDLVVGLLVAILSILIFGLAVSPILLTIGSREGILNVVGAGTVFLFILAFFVWLAAILALSLFLQTIRRACVLEQKGLLASIRLGFALTKHHLKELVPLWLIWMSIRLIWLPLIFPVMVLLVPCLLLTIPLGIALSGAPAALIAGLTALFMEGATPWIIGVLAGLPIFIVVMFSPILFVSGLVEIYKSSIWTIAYGELKAMEQRVQEPTIQAKAITAPG